MTGHTYSCLRALLLLLAAAAAGHPERAGAALGAEAAPHAASGGGGEALGLDPGPSLVPVLAGSRRHGNGRWGHHRRNVRASDGGDGEGQRPLPEASRQQRGNADSCPGYEELYGTIDEDLSTWKATGISKKLMKHTIKRFTTLGRQKGVAFGFQGGRAYVLANTSLSEYAHHGGIWTTYLRVLLDLEERFGPLVPDVQFVIHSVDRPLVLRFSGGNATNYPYMRFCKSDAHPDILIPNFHFYTKDYSNSLLGKVAELNAEYPWANRRPVAFARVTNYRRYVHVDDPHTQRRGAKGADICRPDGRLTLVCNVRGHLIEWASSVPKGSGVDIRDRGRVAMANHARFKYLVHVDGQGLSSRLEQLLPLGSVVFKEESGYRAYYHRLLQPRVHYMPFWVEGPEDLLEGLRWAKEHDDEAREIGARAQALALRYLSTEARACYWLRLLQSYAKLQRFRPTMEPTKLWAWKLGRDFLEQDVRAYQGGEFYNIPFSP